MRGAMAENAGKRRILLVEDNPADADLTQVAFEAIDELARLPIVPRFDAALDAGGSP